MSINYLQEIRNLAHVQSPVIEHNNAVNQEVILKILNDLESKMDGFGESLKITRKAFNIITEGLQNIVRYGDKDVAKETLPIFIYDRQSDRYLLVFGNLVSHAKMPFLQKRLDELNAQDSYGIQEMYKQVIKNNKNRGADDEKDRNSAGLGFLEMARKSEQKFIYKFYPFDTHNSYFGLVVTIMTKSE
ncbi:MAG: hypothetical protein EAZ95_12730 [Bacteroidetes bacterium]|nr:MAG: hypothetical protein EAZ95_12730 [Bacteroidota bacterium]